MTTLVIASGNAGKVREFGQLLEGLGLNTQPQPEGIEVEETGATFAANARLKAEAVAKATGQWALADDSGLSVDALGGAPGVHSARYAATDAARIERLLQELNAAGADAPSSRSACFTAALALADPSGRVVLEVEGHCPGEILRERRGDGGFGYDPVFYVAEAGLCFAEMSKELKAELGHRGKAVQRLKAGIRKLL
ncbi:RdgB/HAM1 family non-canonical purine NTP pyrophosphatase [Synechococcus sp. LTW-R]|uniref:RdgB/HAM1 family non-canonical purine NTP pyrophosphatase n=1 Tax=Synechococcus sp. LTW-R TaxID=2751170 RepID=UPI0016264838|nr:RdgB/HAM1 family non-canonical purine NTP pyrophosphatase [Synechococcus sp. LTW-R]QNG28920.1 RdgB/HAM1 family non-canonical purine NTP pyrophosphatase [Synechococcus sp. LTW-R]